MQHYWLWQKNTKSHHTKLSCIVKVKGCAHSRLSQDRGRVRHDRLQRAAFFYMESVTSRQLLSNDKRQHRKERLGSVLPAYRARKDLLRAQASQTLWAPLSPFSTTSLSLSLCYHISVRVFYHICVFSTTSLSLGVFYHICVCFLLHLSLFFYHICVFSTTSLSVCFLPHLSVFLPHLCLLPHLFLCVFNTTSRADMVRDYLHHMDTIPF